MNIFFLHLLPEICAQMHLNKHVIKMILETAQLLSSAHHMTNCSVYTPKYKLTHQKHPSSIWARQSVENYKWLSRLGLELCKEYTYRYGKIHKSQAELELLAEHIPDLPLLPFTPPLQAMPDMYKSSDCKKDERSVDNTIESYRAYYFFAKTNILSWKGKCNGREIPDWITEMKLMFE
jgi:hypothetical protein